MSNIYEALGKYKDNAIIILINGEAGVGKDTFVKYCNLYTAYKYLDDMVVYTGHRSDIPKCMLRKLGWKGEKTPEVRKLLKELVDFGEANCNLSELEIRSLLFESFKEFQIPVVFYHIRDPKRIKAIKKVFKKDHNVLSLLLQRDLKSKTEEDYWGIQNYDYDLTISVSDMSDSKFMAERLMDEIAEFLKIY